MKKLLILILFVALLFCGCNPGSNSDSKDIVSVMLPDAETATTVNGYLQKETENHTDCDNIEKIEYFANINSKKFHLASCRSAVSIKEENLYKSFNRKLLISDGYEPCKICLD